ncbi:hypothetical protein [Streptomyces eurythermus]|uniref:hypothetical protein n=1 Tax=Streptomyces eurythermus TaxID=42237 RepID=UPI0036F94B80
MQSNDNTRQKLVYLPVPLPKAPPEKSQSAALRAWWKKAWDEGGVLHEMWEDVLSAPRSGLRRPRPPHLELLSAFALRGLTLRRRVVAGRPAQISVRPEIHIPAPAQPADDRPPYAPAGEHRQRARRLLLTDM